MRKKRKNRVVTLLPSLMTVRGVQWACLIVCSSLKVRATRTKELVQTCPLLAQDRSLVSLNRIPLWPRVCIQRRDGWMHCPCKLLMQSLASSHCTLDRDSSQLWRHLSSTSSRRCKLTSMRSKDYPQTLKTPSKKIWKRLEKATSKSSQWTVASKFGRIAWHLDLC